MNLSSTIYPHNLCEKDENKAIPSTHRYFHTLPDRCSIPVENHKNNRIFNHRQMKQKKSL